MLHKIGLLCYLIIGLALPVSAQTVDLSVTDPYQFGESISVNYYIDPGHTCDLIEGAVSGSDGYWQEIQSYGSSYATGGDFDTWADTTQPDTIYYDLYAHWSYGGIEMCGIPDDGNAYATAHPVSPFYTIGGPNTVWWFGGATPANYDTSIVLASNSGVALSWDIVQGANRATLSSSYGSATVLTATDWSGAGEIWVQGAGPDGSASNMITITSRAPKNLSFLGYYSDCEPASAPSGRSYFAHYYYQIRDHFGEELTIDVPANEGFGAVVWDMPITNWPNAGAIWGGGPAYHGIIEDTLRPRRDSAANPSPDCDGSMDEVMHQAQFYGVGDTQAFTGLPVQDQDLYWLISGVQHRNVHIY